MRSTAARLRGRIAELQIPIYRLASLVSYHPTRLGAALRETVPLSDQLADRITRALDALEHEQEAAGR